MPNVDRPFEPSDTCARCGLRRATKKLEEKGMAIRLCDDCFWGQEPAPDQVQQGPPPRA